MALHNYVYLKHREHDQRCHELLVREKDKVIPRVVRSLGTTTTTTTTTTKPAETGSGEGKSTN
ncbi:hypothetical protein ZYGR_0H04740 [Zygosaccharomyces rouxii]|uniref:Uncharacterized protein n=1 Tax=Zygosaccharomyces rouxii TaxID=4956 RepID=A0A1Q2ZWC9_ZYGRO|nr:hypothetical protein ZYGR_0H04740 [Zygosaccharomyces rouxii]